jgi:hypothetical protein
VGVAVWLALWALLELRISHVGPLFRLLRAHGETVLHLVPAGAADVTVAIAPGIAVTVWPLFAVWAVAAALFAWAAWHAGGDAVRL